MWVVLRYNLGRSSMNEQWENDLGGDDDGRWRFGAKFQARNANRVA
jgi:hypothetical protein